MSVIADRPQLDPYIDACDSWCERAESGHDFEPFAGDRRHFGEEIHVQLPLMPPGSKELFITTLEVYLERDDREVEPRIIASIDGANPLTLRLTDAAALRNALAVLLDAVEVE